MLFSKWASAPEEIAETMDREFKEAAVAELAEAIANAQAAILTDYRGMDVAKLTNLRRALAKTSARFKVIKNTLMRRAIEAQPDTKALAWGQLSPHLQGPLGAVFVHGDPGAAARELLEFIRRNANMPRIHIALMEGQVLGPEQVQVVATLPPRPEMLARVVGTLQSPVANLVGTLQSVLGRLTLTLQAIAEQRGGAAAVSG